jgi:dienelactone hydrolase
MRIVTLALFAALLASVSFSQPAPVEKARRAVDLLLQERYQDVVGMLSADTRAALTADKLSSVLGPLLQQAGPVRKRMDPVTQTSGDNQVVTLTVEFANAAMYFVVSLNTSGEINGLRVRPAASPTGPPAPAPSDPAVSRANQALDLLLRERYADVVAMLAPQLRTAVSEDKLRGGLQPVLLGSGAVLKRLEPKVQASGDHRTVILSVQFEKSTWDFIITVNSNGELGGLLARPGTDASVPWVPPAYSKPGLFRTEEVTVGKGDWQLPGTLALPLGRTRVPALVLVHGSGPNDRDETLGPQKPFRDLAEGLASRGIAVLRYEKRTRYAAARLGSLSTFTVQDETVDDALAAAEYLRGRPEIDPGHILVLGHSLGGYLITRIGRRDPKLAGLISMAGPTRPLEDLIVEQHAYFASLQGNAPAALAALEQAKASARKVKALKRDSPPAELIFSIPPSYWLDLQGYDPAVEARTLKQPMLILQGERDYQVLMTDFARWREALKDRNNVRFRSFPALNHLFEAGEGKSTPDEYTAKPSHVAADVIEEIATWIGKT